MFPAVILAGGLAKRLRPITADMPKAMVDVDGIPFIAHQLRLLRASNITKAIICAGYLGHMIEDFVGDGDRFGMRIHFSFDGKHLLGTAGAIKKALPMLEAPFFVLYGDSYLPCDYHAVKAAFERSRKKALMTVFRNNNQWDRSNVEFHEERILNYSKHLPNEKMQHIDYGLGVFHPTSFSLVPENKVFALDRLYQMLIDEGELAAFEVNERFYEIGSFEGLESTRRFLKTVGDHSAQ